MKEALKFENKPLTIRWYSLDSGYTTEGPATEGKSSKKTTDHSS